MLTKKRAVKRLSALDSRTNEWVPHVLDCFAHSWGHRCFSSSSKTDLRQRAQIDKVLIMTGSYSVVVQEA
jgi:hypothetical protein